MSWRLARSLAVLRDEFNTAWPLRSKASDGTLGDAEHATRPSSHNPNSAGVVTGMDITAAGIPAASCAERLRQLGASGHRPLQGGGYVIYNRRSASEKTGWKWNTYTGTNPHISHIHVTVSKNAAGYDDTTPWGIRTPTTQPKDDDFMPALTDTEQRQLLTLARTAAEKASNAALLAASVDQRCARLEASIHGVDDKTRSESLWWRMNYLAKETIEGVKGPMLDAVLRRFGTG